MRSILTFREKTKAQLLLFKQKYIRSCCPVLPQRKKRKLSLYVQKKKEITITNSK